MYTQGKNNKADAAASLSVNNQKLLISQSVFELRANQDFVQIEYSILLPMSRRSGHQDVAEIKIPTLQYQELIWVVLNQQPVLALQSTEAKPLDSVDKLMSLFVPSKKI
jgi:hypothetical protein